MIRWSFQLAQGCVPVEPTSSPRSCASACSCARRSVIVAAAVGKSGHLPVRTSASDAISSPTRSGSSSVPRAAAWSSSKRFTSRSVSGSRSANSSSTATVKSAPTSNPSRAAASCSCAERRCSSPIAAEVTGRIVLDLAMDEPRPLPALSVVVSEWGRIGTIGFGGPPTHIALLRSLCVERRGWLSPVEFEDAIAACNLLTGPASTQLAIYCAWRLRGRLGGLLGGLAFILPGFAAILGLAAVFLAHSPPLWIRGAAAGAGAGVAAVAVQAGLSLLPASRSRARSRLRWAAYAVLGGVAAATIGPWLVLVLVACGVVEIGTNSRVLRMAPAIPALAVPAGGLGALAWVAFKVGGLAYGGGFVIVPLMQNDAVQHDH